MHTTDLEDHLGLACQMAPHLRLTPETGRLLRLLAPILTSAFDPGPETVAHDEVSPLDYLEAHLLAEGLLPEEIWRCIQGRDAVVLLDARPDCDLCGRPARYDAPLARLQHRWANLCPRCWRTDSDGRLGAGHGQQIGLYGALPAAVIDMLNAPEAPPARSTPQGAEPRL